MAFPKRSGGKGRRGSLAEAEGMKGVECLRLKGLFIVLQLLSVII
jgi:hypothetical protein